MVCEWRCTSTVRSVYGIALLRWWWHDVLRVLYPDAGIVPRSAGISGVGWRGLFLFLFLQVVVMADTDMFNCCCQICGVNIRYISPSELQHRCKIRVIRS